MVPTDQSFGWWKLIRVTAIRTTAKKNNHNWLGLQHWRSSFEIGLIYRGFGIAERFIPPPFLIFSRLPLGPAQQSALDSPLTRLFHLCLILHILMGLHYRICGWYWLKGIPFGGFSVSRRDSRYELAKLLRADFLSWGLLFYFGGSLVESLDLHLDEICD